MLGQNEDRGWGSRRTYLLVLLCQLLGTTTFVAMTNVALSHGATGFIIAYLVAYFAIGIPLLYMEFIISQFTARDCIEVWKVRSCLSHIGYIVVAWQVFIIITNHVTASFTFHYFIISFESPIPYYTCGNWSTLDCQILKHNYTVNQDCIRLKTPPTYCDNLYVTFPEYQYWKIYMLGSNKKREYFVAWRVCLASALISVITYLSCFKRKSSVKWVVLFYTAYPVFGYTLLLMGSMLQKGVVVMYADVFDSDFSLFFKRFRMSLAIMQVISNLGIGSGFTFNLNSSTSFRAPCYSNAVVAVVASAAACTLAICTTALMTCPYAYEYGIDPDRIFKSNMAFIYERMPRLLFEYQTTYFWLLLALSSQAILGMSTNIILLHHLLEMAATRSVKVARYPGLTALLAVVLIYFITIPLLGNFGMTTLLGVRRMFCYITIFVSIIETVVFVIWYGLDRFTEDVHFMQGIQPKTFMKVAWLYSCAILCYVFCYEFYTKFEDYNGSSYEKFGFITLITCLVLIVGLTIAKLLIATCRNRLNEAIRLDPTWGPRDEVLQRSRAMFTAQAMTKEYLYRQYHLQAGIQMRQRMSNCRAKRDVFLKRNSGSQHR